MIFTRLARKNGAASTFALAIALATGGMIGAAALEAPAVVGAVLSPNVKFNLHHL